MCSLSKVQSLLSRETIQNACVFFFRIMPFFDILSSLKHPTAECWHWHTVLLFCKGLRSMMPSLSLLFFLHFRAGTMGVLVEYGIEKKITSFSTLGATISVASFSGVNLNLKYDFCSVFEPQSGKRCLGNY